MNSKTLFYIFCSITALIFSMLFGELTHATRAETHLMFIGWLIVVSKQNRE